MLRRTPARPEAAFVLLGTCEPEMVPPKGFSRILERGCDWDAVIALAGEQRVAAFVLQAVQREGLPMPSQALGALRARTLESRARAMLLDALLAQVGAAMAAVGLPVMVLKGPALARTIYPAECVRPYDDVDLVVRPSDEQAARDVLVQLGFQEIPDEAEEIWFATVGRIPGAAAYHRRFYAADGSGVVELHIDPLQLGLPPVCDAGRWQRALPLPHIQECLLLCPEDQLVQLSVHAHKHGFSRLIWLKDLDLLLRSHAQRFDWDLAVATAQQEGVGASVWYSLFLAQALLRTPVPEPVLRCLQPAPWLRHVYRRVWPLDSIRGMRGRMRRRAVQFRGADAWRGMLPSLVLMGRRRDRARVIAHVTAGRLGQLVRSHCP